MRCIVAAALCLLVSNVLAQEVLKHEGSDELKLIKGLAGTWTGEMDHGQGPEPVTIVYRVTAGGSAVVETFNPDTPMEMVTVYHDRNGKLVMTHYCMLGNQPHMKLTGSSEKSVSLELAKKSGIKKGEAHMSGLTIEFESADKIKQIWTLNTGGKSSEAPAIELTRKN